jgi:hypothetical protein
MTVLICLGFVLVMSGSAKAAATVTPPDMVIRVPTNLISIGIDGSGHKQLRFTHITEDAGTGPFEIDPTYNAATGTATFVQRIYNSPSPGVWQSDHTVPVAATGVFNTVTHSDYAFPLTKFTLNAVNSDGSIGAVLATSPKTDYCITGDNRVGDVPNTPTQTSPPQSNCTDPTEPLGWSVGWGDQYDQTDAGQPIDINSVPDGTYILHALVDPQHVLTESDPTNNATDTKLTISGNTWTIISQTNPGSTQPTVAITNPAAGSVVSGTVTVSANAAAVAPATVASVRLLLDGQPLGAALTQAPFNYSWTIGSVAPGTHQLSAQVTDSNGLMATATPVAVMVAAPVGGFTVDRQVSQTGKTSVVTPAFSTSVAGDVLLAMVSSDGNAGQTATVSGAGLNWTLVKRANAQPGDSEIWTATAPSTLSNVTVTSTAGQAGFDQQLTLLALEGAGGVGASAAAGASTGASSVSYTATAAGSLGLAVGNDYDQAVGRTVGAGQTLVSQFLDTTSGDTYWSQSTTGVTSTAGQSVTLNDTAPTGDRWNLAGAEVVPAGGPPDTTPPSINLTNPVASQTVAGSVTVAANATDNVGVASVQFTLDGQPLGNAVTSSPYAIPWDTTTVPNGTHTLAATAKDAAGNLGTATSITVTVQNPAPPMTCFVLQAQVSVHGHGAVTSAAFHTAMAGEVLLAFVSADGPGSANSQTTTVSGAGLKWTLVKRANAQYGDAEIWTATANSVLTSATVKSTLAKSGYDQNLTVQAWEGATGAGASAAASAASGAPSVNVKTTGPASSLVLAAGDDWDTATARTLPTGQVMANQYLDTATGDTFWSQYTNAAVSPAGTVVTMHDTAPTADRWNMAAVELVGALG